MAYRDNKAYDFRLVKHMAHSELTIDLGKEFSGTVTAFMKTSSSSSHYREFEVTGGRYISLTKSQTMDLIEGNITYPIDGRWYVNVWQVKTGESVNQRQIIYTGKILFIGQIDSYKNDNTVWFFQYDNASDDISNIDLINASFLSSNGQKTNESELKLGKYISMDNLGRYGLYVPNSNFDPPYKIYNELGSEITSSFDYIYQDNSAYYVSKEFAVPSTIYFKIANH